MSNWDHRLLYVLCFFLGMLLVNFLWRRRQRKILKSLNEIIEAENESRKNFQFKNPGDIEDALKALFEARKEELEKMKMLESYRREYIGNVAHELKTPIFAIRGYLDSIEELAAGDKPDLETVLKFLEKAQKNTDRLSRIIEDLDTITKYESGFLRLEFEVFNIHDLVKDVVESLEMAAREKGIQLFETANPGDYAVWADRFRIRQVLTNLGYNSIKYGKVNGNTRFKLSHTGNRVIVEVADNGIGIPKSHLNRIFERFYRVEKSRSRDSGGSGLGLSICKHIIEAHGENIHVMSTEGAGSVFSFSLKANPAD